MNKTYAIILAGGLGSRLRPFTYSIPKPLIKVQGKPIMQYAIENLKKNNINNIIIASGYKSHKIEDYFKDGKKFSVKIEYIKTGPFGTGGAIKECAKNLINTFIVINGDNIANYDFTKLLKEHKKNKALATLALYKAKDVSQYGVVNLNKNVITKFIEKPKIKVKSNLINAGAYILEPKILEYIKKKKCSLEKDVFEELAKKKVIYGKEHKKQWFPTDNFERYYIATKKLKVKDF
jgi:NDP-sugar pyrophosphorylase family protein